LTGGPCGGSADAGASTAGVCTGLGCFAWPGGTGGDDCGLGSTGAAGAGAGGGAGAGVGVGAGAGVGLGIFATGAGVATLAGPVGAAAGCTEAGETGDTTGAA
jgi:hypothetical protein